MENYEAWRRQTIRQRARMARRYDPSYFDMAQEGISASNLAGRGKENDGTDRR